MVSGANQHQIANLKLVLGASEVLAVDVAILGGAEKVGDVLPIGEEAI